MYLIHAVLELEISFCSKMMHLLSVWALVGLGLFRILKQVRCDVTLGRQKIDILAYEFGRFMAWW